MLSRRSRRHLSQSPVPTVAGKGEHPLIQRSWVSPPQPVPRSPANYKPEHHPVQSFSQPRDHDSKRPLAAWGQEPQTPATGAPPAWVHRVTTDSRAVTEIAAEVTALTGWTNEQPGS